MHSPNVLHLCQISLARALVVCSWFAPCAVYTRRRSNQSDGCGLAHAHHSAPFALLHSSPPRFLDGNPSRRTRQMCCLQQSQPSWLGLSPREAVCTTRSSRKLMQSCQTQSRCLYLLQSGLLASPESVPGCLQGDAVARPSPSLPECPYALNSELNPTMAGSITSSISRCMTVRSKSLGARRAPVYE